MARDTATGQHAREYLGKQVQELARWWLMYYPVKISISRERETRTFGKAL